MPRENSWISVSGIDAPYPVSVGVHEGDQLRDRRPIKFRVLVEGHKHVPTLARHDRFRQVRLQLVLLVCDRCSDSTFHREDLPII